MIIRYDPKKHKDMPLYEMQTRTTDDIIATVWVKSLATHEQAAAAPWYYGVEVPDVPVSKSYVVVRS